MKFSIVIPSYNYASTLPVAVDSVLAAHRGDVEVLVIDDASTDHTPEVVRRYGETINYVRLAKNHGPAGAWGRGMELARGEFLLKLDADDWILPGFFDRADHVLCRDIDILVASVYDYEDGARDAVVRRIVRVDEVLDADAFRARLLRSFFVRMPALILRAEMARSVAPPRSDLWIGHDWEFLLRATGGSRAATVADPMAVVRFHTNSVTATARIDSDVLQHDFQLMLDRAVDVNCDGYLPLDQQRVFRLGLANQYLRITQGRSMKRQPRDLVRHIRFAVHLSGGRLAAPLAAAVSGLAAHRANQLRQRRTSIDLLLPSSFGE